MQGRATQNGDRRNRSIVIEPQGHVSRSVAQWQLASRNVPGAAAGDVSYFGRNQNRDLREQIPVRAKIPKGSARLPKAEGLILVAGAVFSLIQ